MSKKVLLSGIQPSGKPHIGNYFGLMKRIVEYQDEYTTYFFIADYHALTTYKNREALQQNIIDIVIDYLAIGLDPEKSIIFKQSDVSEHTELAWIFDTVTTMSYLERAHAYKAAVATGDKEITVGLFNYPLLMAADILLYDTAIVPTGQDQKQHVEIARDTAEKFNNKFGETFTLPEPKIADIPVIPGMDGRKMSKSYGNTIPLFAEYDEIKKLVMGIVTDSSGDIPENVYAIHQLLRPEAELKTIYEEKKGKYKELKELLIEDLEKFIAPIRDRRKVFEKDVKKALKILEEGGKKAKKVAEAKMKEVRQKIGVDVY